MSRSKSSTDDPNSNDVGAPLPDFRAASIQLQTIAPALGVTGQYNKPDYLEYDAGGRGIVVTMFANTGLAYLLGIGGGGIYGFRQGRAATPSNRFRVQLNSILNHTGRYGSRAGNTFGVVAVLYSLYEGLADRVSKQRVFRHRTTVLYPLLLLNKSQIARQSQCKYLTLSLIFSD